MIEQPKLVLTPEQELAYSRLLAVIDARIAQQKREIRMKRLKQQAQFLLRKHFFMFNQH